MLTYFLGHFRVDSMAKIFRKIRQKLLAEKRVKKLLAIRYWRNSFSGHWYFGCSSNKYIKSRPRT